MTRFTCCCVTVLLSIFLLTPSARAVDGTVLINQNTVVSGLPGCPTGGHLPIIICQPGSYKLSGNITVGDANTDAIDINSDNVTLDMNGFAILGPATCKPNTYPVQCSTTGTGRGIYSDHNNQISIRNGTVNGMGSSGVVLNGPVGNVVESLHVTNNASSTGAGVVVRAGIVRRCTVSVNAGHGISGAEATTISSNAVFSNGGNGINGGGVVSENSVYANGQDGIAFSFLAVNNTSLENVGYGISGDSTIDGFTGNVISDNGLGAIHGVTSLGHNFCEGVVC